MLGQQSLYYPLCVGQQKWKKSTSYQPTLQVICNDSAPNEEKDNFTASVPGVSGFIYLLVQIIQTKNQPMKTEEVFKMKRLRYKHWP